MHALFEVESAFHALAGDQGFQFQKELDGILKDYVGRESPLYFAERLTEHYKPTNGEGPHIYLKREDLNHTGAHKINNVVAQALLAKCLGKKCIIAETGADTLFMTIIPLNITIKEVETQPNATKKMKMKKISAMSNGFGSFKNLTLLSLTNNRLHGQLPDLRGISRLQVLNLSMNGFSSGLPDLLKSLITAFLGNNSFFGEIPKRYGQLNNLQYLDVSSNMLRGSPPDALFSLPKISYINLGSNSFALLSIHLRCSGKLPFVDLSNNKLIGGLPPCLNVDSGNLEQT